MHAARGPAPEAGLTPGVRWGLPDVAWCWVTGFVGAVLAGGLAIAASGLETDEAVDDPWVAAVSLLGQAVATLAALVLVSSHKGRRDLRTDFGLDVDPRDWAWLLAGVGLQVAAGLMVLPLDGLTDDRQQVVERLQEASGRQLLLLALLAGLVAPVVEELLFRGLLLRALLRRFSATAAVAVSAVVFGLVHLSDPSALVILPGLTLVGLLTAWQAVRTGSLSRPILIHTGFNSVVVVGILVS